MANLKFKVPYPGLASSAPCLSAEFIGAVARLTKSHWLVESSFELLQRQLFHFLWVAVTGHTHLHRSVEVYRYLDCLKRIVVVTHRTTPVADDAHFGDVRVCHQRDRKRGTLETLLGQGK
ncbi:hypothetical protein D3C81_1019250 [compost metagenome]